MAGRQTPVSEPPNLRGAFPHAIPLEAYGTLQDETFNPGCGYTSAEESAILYRLACSFPGDWIEFGSHTGWSGAYIASAGVTLHAVEPMFRTHAFYQRARRNWERAGVLDRIIPYACYSHQLDLDGASFAGAFVDGDHEPGEPLRDAQLLLPRMRGRCVIVFHDYIGQPVIEAVDWVAEQGFRVMVYETTQRLAVCCRDWEPV